MTRHYQLFLLSVLFVLRLGASHILGGEIFYDYLGSDKYRITLKMYRNCLAEPAFDGLPDLLNGNIVDPVLSVYDGSGNFMIKILLDPPSVTSVPPNINNPCITTPDTVCMEEGVYTKTITLPPQTGGYYVVYQRCCRSNSALNLLNNPPQGSTYYTRIPGPEIAGVNSSPRFLGLPPEYLCNGMELAYDHSAVDPDGDVLVYSLTAPFTGVGNCCSYIPLSGWSPTLTPFGCPSSTCPVNGSPPPYTPVPYISPYSGSYPMASSPSISIHPSTGSLTGVPNIIGNWVVGVQVLEYRNNVLIGVHFRDFMFSVVPCIITVKSVIAAQAQTSQGLCAGSPITFTNQSVGGNTWHWDFGVNNLTSDTSNLTNPTYAYQDTGRYLVTLIANPGKPCADTSVQYAYVYPKLSPTFVAPSPQCITSNHFNYNVGGTYASYTTFNWNFGINASPTSATTSSVSNVVYNQPGKFPVTVIVKQRVCIDTLIDTARVYPKPVVNYDSTQYSLCEKSAITITNVASSNFPTTYYWTFSNGVTSSVRNPTLSFSPAGVYSATVITITNNGCIDTAKIVLPGFVTVNPSPVAAFSPSPSETSIFEPEIHFLDHSQHATVWHYDFGDGLFADTTNPVHTYQTYGDFPVLQTVTNQFGCVDTVIHLVKINPEFRYWVPNAFTPGNKDDLNDIFFPITFGVEEYEFAVFDRWGECVFKTGSTDEGWDGTFHSSPCKPDVYSYRITFKNVVSKKHEWHYGSITLIR